MYGGVDVMTPGLQEFRSAGRLQQDHVEMSGSAVFSVTRLQVGLIAMGLSGLPLPEAWCRQLSRNATLLEGERLPRVVCVTPSGRVGVSLLNRAHLAGDWR